MKLNIHVVNISHADNFILPLKMAHAFGCDDSANTFSKGGGGRVNIGSSVRTTTLRIFYDK